MAAKTKPDGIDIKRTYVTVTLYSLHFVISYRGNRSLLTDFVNYTFAVEVLLLIWHYCFSVDLSSAELLATCYKL